MSFYLQDGHTALTEAMQRNHSEVISLLAANKDLSTVKVPEKVSTAKTALADNTEAKVRIHL